MFCTKCGFKMDDDSLFCANCGSKVTTLAPNQEEVKQEEAKSTVVEPVITEQAVNEPVVMEQAVSEPVISEPVISEPIVAEPTRIEPIVSEQASDTTEEPEDESFAQESFVRSQVSEPVNLAKNNTTNNAQYSMPNNMQQNRMNNVQPNNMQQNMVNNYQSNNYNAPTREKGRFSVKRFIFSLLVIIASVAACVSVLVLPYVTLNLETTVEEGHGDGAKIEESYKVIDLMQGKLLKGNTEDKIIKQVIEIPEMADLSIYGYWDDDVVDEITDDSKDLKEDAEFAKTLAIILVIVVGVATIINIVLCCALRKKVTYVFTLLLSLVNLGLGGFMFYMFNFDIVEQVTEIMDMLINPLDYTANMDLMAEYTVGAIVFLASQAVIFISSIILLTCKNRKKIGQTV